MNYKEIFKNLGDTEEDVCLIRRVCDDVRREKPKESVEVFEWLLRYINENNLYKVYPFVLLRYSQLLGEIGELEKAIELNVKSIEKYKELGEKDEILDAINYLVGKYSNNQMYNEAIEYARLGLKIAEETNNYKRVSLTKSYIAIIYIELEEFEEARELLRRTLELPNIGEKSSEIADLINLSECELECKDFDDAKIHMERGMELAKVHRTDIILYINIMFGRLYSEIKEYELAYECFEKSTKEAKENGKMVYINEAMIYWSSVDLALGKYEEAIEKIKDLDCKKCNIFSQKSKNILYKNLSEAYAGLGNYKKSYEYSNKLLNWRERFNQRKIEFAKLNSGAKEKEENKIYKILQDETERIYTIGKEITSNLNRENIYSVVEREMKTLFQYDYVQIAIREGNYLNYQLCIEENERVPLAQISLDKESVSTYAFKNKEPVLINDMVKEGGKYIKDIDKLFKMSLEMQEHKTNKFTESIINVPIIVGDEAIGIVSIQSYEKNNYDLNDVNRLKVLSTYLGIALENSRYYREIKYNATYDTLTKILNRRTILDKIETIYRNVCSDNDSINNNSYIIMIDIDNFKNINDTYGHQAGDKVLMEVAGDIEKTIGDKGIIGRYGGEEFIVVISESDNKFKQTAEEIRKNIEMKTIISENIEIKVTASIGAAVMDKNSKNINEVIKKADKCLYEAKNTGKNKVVVYKKIQ